CVVTAGNTPRQSTFIVYSNCLRKNIYRIQYAMMRRKKERDGALVESKTTKFPVLKTTACIKISIRYK
ncbi:hypothetical protein, partial [Asticcacaulis sp.]|uniref:hypothetical protein n=1 Tax=Asticcacaulis sp. TaxID=1872648 RepID=UPI00262AED36